MFESSTSLERRVSKRKFGGVGAAIIESVETLSGNSPLSGWRKVRRKSYIKRRGVYRDNLESTYSCSILCPGELDFWSRGYNERHAESVSNSGQRFLSQPPLINARRKQTRDKARYFFFPSRSVFKLITREGRGRRSNFPFFIFLNTGV